MIASFYGKEYSLESLQQLCNISRNGVSLSGISETAELISFKTLGGKITFSEPAYICITENQNRIMIKKDQMGGSQFKSAKGWSK
jgi:ABC-type bacteriocin/lantibiotic exporter with double-glycine peptidase domain